MFSFRQNQWVSVEMHLQFVDLTDDSSNTVLAPSAQKASLPCSGAVVVEFVINFFNKM